MPIGAVDTEGLNANASDPDAYPCNRLLKTPIYLKVIS